MQYLVSVQHREDTGALLEPFFPDVHAVFDLPHDARQHLLALVADEISAGTETTCRWLDTDTIELEQPSRPVPYRTQRFQVIQVTV